MIMNKLKPVLMLFALFFALNPAFNAQQATEKAVPVFVDGEAQVVPGFEDPQKWMRHDLWVETEFDTDGDGKRDRMHVAVTRPLQTETEGLKLPVIYVTSPYFAGTAEFVEGLFWSVRHNLGEMAPREYIRKSGAGVSVLSSRSLT